MIEPEIVSYVAEAIADPLGRFSVALLTGSPQLGIDSLLARGVVPRIIDRSVDESQDPVQLSGEWSETGTVHYCLSEADVPSRLPPAETSVRVLLVACTDVEALPAWVTADGAPPVRTLPVGPLSLFEAHDAIEARLGGPVDAESAYTLASLSGFTHVPLDIIIGESRSNGVLERLGGIWSLLGDPVQLAVVPYLRAQLAAANPAYARIMFHLALVEPFSLAELGSAEAQVAEQLLREGELHHRSDGRLEFAAAAAAAALQAVAPADQQRQVYGAALQGSTPSLRAIAWAVRHEQPVRTEHFEHAAETAFAEQSWQTLIEIADLAAKAGRSHGDDGSERAEAEYTALRCALHLHAAMALQRTPDSALAPEHLAHVERMLSEVRPEVAAELEARLRIARAEILHYGAGDLDGALETLALDSPEHGMIRARTISHAFLHLVHGGRHAEARELLESERGTLRLAPQDLADRVAAAESLLLASAGTPAAGLRKIARLATRHPAVSEDTLLMREELRSAYVITALASDGPSASPLLEKRLGELAGAGYRPDLAGIYCLRGSWEYSRGDIAAAHRSATLALDVADSVDPSGFAAAAIALLAETSALRGDHAAATALTARFSQEPARASAIVAGRAQAHLSAAHLLLDTAHAGETLRRAAHQFVDQGQWGFAAEILYSGVRFGRRRAARDLREIADRLDGELHRMRAEHAAALLDGDPVALFAVAEQLREAGMGLHAAEAVAAMLRMTDTPESLRNRATGLLATFLSAQPVSGHPLLRSPDAPAGEAKLTPREQEVARLISSGLRNTEVADRLKLSLATVEGHITRIYRKTGGSRRAPARR